MRKQLLNLQTHLDSIRPQIISKREELRVVVEDARVLREERKLDISFIEHNHKE